MARRVDVSAGVERQFELGEIEVGAVLHAPEQREELAESVGGLELLINFIIRPPRAEYNPKNDLLDQEFLLKGKWYQRKDLEVKNSRGDVLQCSHYMPVVPPEGSTLPCVIYCHGNSSACSWTLAIAVSLLYVIRFIGCRTDASEAAVILLLSNITVFTLDFSGSGLSGGEHVTLGWNEKDDLKAVVDYLRADGNVSFIGLWGRSMGAVTSPEGVLSGRIFILMYGAEDPSIAGMVLDSPFSDLVDLMMELVDTYKVRLPKFTVKFAIQYMRKAIQKKAKFDIMELNTIKVAKSCFVPVLFGHAIEDDFIQPHHSDRVFDAYVGDKNIIKFEGDHNSPRPQFYFDSVSIFFNNVLQPPEDGGGRYFDLSNDYFTRGRWSTVQDVELSDELLGSPSGPPATSTEDAIRQLRSRRPMSATVVPADISSKDDQPDSESNGASMEKYSSILATSCQKGENQASSPHYEEVAWQYCSAWGKLNSPFLITTLMNLLNSPFYALPFAVSYDISPSMKTYNGEIPFYALPCAVESRSSDAQPSTSNMISLEFPRDSPHGSLVPGSIDDDEYVEYSLDMMADFPSNVEEEERMLMVAIFESLKDSKEPSSSVGSSSLPKPEPAPKDEAEGSIILPQSHTSENQSSSEAEASKTCSPSDTQKAETSTVKKPTSNAGASPPKQGETSQPMKSKIDAPSEDHRQSDGDMADRTKVTMEVEKNPTTNIIDGLLRRWDIFRNR
ncbi:hypothetical protein SASPL_112328 [Salvia splendens]|uniref:Serine aminopeptidase S33 domain-containing protein n=1 Tax=Salvia splendens TaxID=180675 RepID=A0A8X8YB10_SALSN|nr:hypothetical protein SASPL_112328 [Salvia splendens]